jgi:hypothetical protein
MLEMARAGKPSQEDQVKDEAQPETREDKDLEEN